MCVLQIIEKDLCSHLFGSISKLGNSILWFHIASAHFIVQGRTWL